MKSLLFFVELLFVLNLFANEQPRSHTAIRTDEAIKIDGFFDELIWDKVPTASNFVESEPEVNSTPNGDTEVKLVYDDNALYIAAKMYDPNPGDIIKPFTNRDESSNSSWFGVTIDTYGSGLNGVAFIITAAGVQSDMQISPDGDDRSWNTVWTSKVRLTADGWQVELEIPYSALRFPDKDIQEWKVQFGRQTRRLREFSFWNPLDPNIEGFINQCGYLEGIENIKPPIRLAFTPFIVGGTKRDNSEGDISNSSFYGAGLDMKLGLNDAFTLDMTLIPDFSNTISDQEVLNLSPFEVFFEENRQFFTEGTELFNKGDFFYSRRIGSSPVNANLAEESLLGSEKIKSNPSTNQLINATKVSGRNKNGLGVGVINAIEKSTKATIVDTISGIERLVETQPFTNYNVLVLDQNLKNNSYVSLINTSVLRKGDTYDANVTGGVFRFRNASQNFEASGKVGVSQKFNSEDNVVGHTYDLQLAKIGGKWKYSMDYSEKSDNYDPNDIGFLIRPNQREWEIDIDHNQFAPTLDFFTRYSGWFNLEYTRIYNPNVFSDFAINMDGFALTKNFFAFGMFARYEPIETFDYFEPRTEDLSRYYRFPTNFIINPFISTDWSKPVAVDFNVDYRKFSEDGRYTIGATFNPRFRISDRLYVIFQNSVYNTLSDVGYVDKDNIDNQPTSLSTNSILFGVRDRIVVTNSLRADLVFNENMFLNLRLRHYWDRVEYLRYGTLNEDGTLTSIDFDGLNEEGEYIFNQDFDLFTVDLIYTWRFAPGSDLILTWKNNGLHQQKEIGNNYFDALGRIYDQFQSNEISIKLLYYFDYNYLRKLKNVK